MALHKDLTGADLHEPKGVTAAASGTVYVADGLGSGAWASKDANNLTLNKYWLTSRMDDVSTPLSSAWFRIPIQSELFEVSAVLRNAITLANSICSIYINGVLFPENMTIPFSGSTAGDSTLETISTSHTISAGSVVEIRSDGGATTVAIADIALGLRAK